MEENVDPPIGIIVRKFEPYKDQQIPRAPQREESESEEGIEDKENVGPTMAQGSTHIMDNIDALFIEKIAWKRSMFDQILAGQALLSQRQDVLSQNVAEVKLQCELSSLIHP